MLNYVIKRDGSKVDFDRSKIENAISKAFITVYPKSHIDYYKPSIIAATDKAIRFVEWVIGSKSEEVSIEIIQDAVENELMKIDSSVAKEYITYRYKRKLIREYNTTDKSIQELLTDKNDYLTHENSNKNPILVTVKRDYLAGITSTDITKRFLLTDDIREADEAGIIHFHDQDYYIQDLHNCDLINLDDMLQNGTIVNKIMIERPHRLLKAATIATQIITAVTSSQYGGATISLTHLAPFVRDSYNKFLEKYRNRNLPEEQCVEFAKEDLKKEVEDSVQTFNYQCNSMTTTNGQSPFLSVFMYLGETDEYKDELAMLIEEFLRQRILGMKNEVGVYITPAFPKLLYVLEEDNITEDSKYYYLTELAAKCTAKRMVPDYISEKMMLKYKGDCYPCMGCRSFLTPDRFTDKGIGNIANAKNYVENKHKYYGRFNQGVVTLNLVDLALSSNKDLDKFWELFDERTELCHKALRLRHDKLKGVVSDVAPILWQDGALARLAKGEKIDKLLYNGYSTISLGYAGLYECVKYMTGESHSEPEGMKFGLKLMQALNDKCKLWRDEENIDYSLYGTPIESATYKFAQKLKKRFGVIEGITDRDYITNSYHIPVFEKINPYEKLAIESKFQQLSPGGAISYIECCDMTHNIPAVIDILKFIYDNIMYAELNTKSDYCQVCGYDGEIKLIDEHNELIWECPNCGNRDTNKLNVARRTCGYIGTNFWNKGRTQEINERYVHLDDHSLSECE